VTRPCEGTNIAPLYQISRFELRVPHSTLFVTDGVDLLTERDSLNWISGLAGILPKRGAERVAIKS
jgi:hypothetical protein